MTVKAKIGLVLVSLVILIGSVLISAQLQLRHETQVRVQAEQQLLMSLSLMVEPFLAQNKVEQVKGHLLASSFSSTLPIKAILVYQADGNLFAATQFPRELFNFSPTRDLTGQRALQDGSNLLWSAVMVTPASMSYFEPQHAVAEGSTLGYVAIQISPLRLSTIWLWQTCLWVLAVVCLLSLALFGQYKAFQLERLRWNSFTAQLRSLLPDEPQHHPAAGKVLQERSRLIRLLSGRIQKLQQHEVAESELLQEQDQIQQASQLQLEAGYQQKMVDLKQQLSEVRQQLNQWRQLSALHDDQTQAGLLQWLVRSEQLSEKPLEAEHLWFPQWLEQQAKAWQGSCQQQNVNFILIEDAALSLSEVQFYAEHVAELLHQVLALILDDLQQNDLSMHINLQSFLDHKLFIQFDHAGQSKAIKQVLQQDNPSDAAVLPALCAALLRRLGAKLSVSSLEDLGCSVRLELPLQAVMVREYPMYQTAIFVDADPQRGALLKQSIYALAEQVIYIQQPQQLLAELQNRLVDLVLIQLPEQQDSFTAEDELIAVASRGHLVGFCAAEQLSYWTDRLTFPVLSNPMLSATVRATLSALPQQNRSRLLVVDDNTTNLAFVKAMLSHQELEVDSAASGEEAIRLAKSNRYQLILMDIQLPDMSGVLATHLIRQLPQHQHTQIMAFTAHALPAEIEQFRQAGMNDVVIKPLDAAKVATLIRHCLSPDLQSQSPVPDQTVV